MTSEPLVEMVFPVLDLISIHIINYDYDYDGDDDDDYYH